MTHREEYYPRYYTKVTHAPTCSALRCWARGQLQYILGANPRGVSYVVGYHGPAANEVSPERWG
jgi:hypothetical protein